MKKGERWLGAVVVVTGASSGIGWATAQAFAARGANVVLVARRLDRMWALSKKVPGAPMLSVRCDITRRADVAKLANRLKRAFGRVDLLVCNAGVGLYGTLEACLPEQVAQVFETNVLGSLRVTQALTPLLRESAAPGIVVVSSTLAKRPLPRLGAYAASKAALETAAAVLREELKRDGIAVGVVAPDVTDTDFQSTRPSAPGFRTERLAGPKALPARVADALVDAATRQHRYVRLDNRGRVVERR